MGLLDRLKNNRPGDDAGHDRSPATFDELQAAGDIADGEHPGVGGAQPRIHLDALRIVGDAGSREAEILDLRLAAGGEGETAVEKAVDNLARAVGWEAADGPRQGAVMIGVYTAEDGIGVPAIFDGESRWIVSNTGNGWATLSAAPERIWEIPHAAA